MVVENIFLCCFFTQYFIDRKHCTLDAPLEDKGCVVQGSLQLMLTFLVVGTGRECWHH